MDLLNESTRCLKCKKPQCSLHCPVSTPIPEVMALFMEQNILEAGRILFENNPLSAITSIVCPHERNCTGHCVLGRNGNSIHFYEIESYISKFYLDTVKLTPPPSNGILVAVIGAGPAGIAMSLRLALKGFKVTLIEAHSKIGGVLRFGIPEFRLPNSLVDQYAEVLHDLGVKFKPNTFVGSYSTMEDMFVDGYKAIFVAVGTSKPRKLGLLGETLGNVHYAVDFLKNPESYFLGEKVVIIGAGNVAMDAARMARRRSPKAKVTVINNRRAEDMTGTKHEIQMAMVDGVEFVHLQSTLRLTEDHIVCAEVTASVDEDGKAVFTENMNQITNIPADTIIVAIGQGPQAAVLASTQVSRNDMGLVMVDEKGRTDIPGIFAAGDIVTGPKTVVEAVAFTKTVADEIEEYCLK